MTETEREVAVVGGYWARLSDGTTWPLPDTEDDGLAWRMTYGTPSRSDMVRAVSILNAYGYLLTETNRDRTAMVKREIRAALTTHASPAATRPDTPTNGAVDA